MKFADVLQAPEGPDRTAATAAWLQGLYPSLEEAPVLVGGAAVELYTRGVYRSADLDLVGSVPSAVRAGLRDAGFVREGRHWVHEASRTFLEFPAAAFDRKVRIGEIRRGAWTVRVIGPEDLLLDRLAAWAFWGVPVEGANAFLLWKDRGATMNRRHLAVRAKEEGLEDALAALRKLARAKPTMEEVQQWSDRGR